MLYCWWLTINLVTPNAHYYVYNYVVSVITQLCGKDHHCRKYLVTVGSMYCSKDHQARGGVTLEGH